MELTQSLEGSEHQLEAHLGRLAGRETLEQKAKGQHIGRALERSLFRLAELALAHVQLVVCRFLRGTFFAHSHRSVRLGKKARKRDTCRSAALEPGARRERCKWRTLIGGTH